MTSIKYKLLLYVHAGVVVDADVDTAVDLDLEVGVVDVENYFWGWWMTGKRQKSDLLIRFCLFLVIAISISQVPLFQFPKKRSLFLNRARMQVKKDFFPLLVVT